MSINCTPVNMRRLQDEVDAVRVENERLVAERARMTRAEHVLQGAYLNIRAERERLLACLESALHIITDYEGRDKAEGRADDRAPPYAQIMAGIREALGYDKVPRGEIVKL